MLHLGLVCVYIIIEAIHNTNVGAMQLIGAKLAFNIQFQAIIVAVIGSFIVSLELALRGR